MTRAEMAQILAIRGEMFRGGNSSTEEQINTWMILLGSFPANVVTTAVIDFAKEDEKGFAPTPGQIYQRVKAKAEEAKALQTPKISKEMQEYFDKIHRWWDEMDEQIAEQNLEKEMGIYEARL